MPEPLSHWVSYLDIFYSSANMALVEARFHQTEAVGYNETGDVYMAIGSLCESVYWANGAIQYLCSPFWETMYDYCVPTVVRWMDENWAAAPDMDDIVNAMLKAEYSQLQQFIGIEDAYRVALWNKPFNSEFYAALARGFLGKAP
jgi:hypothetical protein